MKVRHSYMRFCSLFSCSEQPNSTGATLSILLLGASGLLGALWWQEGPHDTAVNHMGISGKLCNVPRPGRVPHSLSALLSRTPPAASHATSSYGDVQHSTLCSTVHSTHKLHTAMGLADMKLRERWNKTNGQARWFQLLFINLNYQFDNFFPSVYIVQEYDGSWQGCESNNTCSSNLTY